MRTNGGPHVESWMVGMIWEMITCSEIMHHLEYTLLDFNNYLTDMPYMADVRQGRLVSSISANLDCVLTVVTGVCEPEFRVQPKNEFFALTSS